MVDDYTSAERRANVKKQLRDRKGRWLRMGFKVRFLLNGKYTTGEVNGLDPDRDQVSVQTPDGTTHVRKSGELENIGAKASLRDRGNDQEQGQSRDQEQERPKNEEDDSRTPRANLPDRNGEDSGQASDGDGGSSGKSKEERRKELDDRIRDLELEEDVLKDDGEDKDRIREVQKERQELQRERAALDNSDDNKNEGGSTDRSSEKSEAKDDSKAEGQDDSKAEKSSSAPDLPDNGDDESSSEKPGGGLPNLPEHGDDESSLSKPPNADLPNLPENRDSIDVVDIDNLVDGDRVFLEDTVNGAEDITEFLREEGAWVGSNDFDDLDLAPDDLKYYIEARDPKDLFVVRAANTAKAGNSRVTADTPAGTRVAFSLGGADGTGRLAGTDSATDTAEISIGEQTIELPLDELSVFPDENAADGPITEYVPPAVAFNERFPDPAKDGPLSSDEKYAYDAIRDRLSILLRRTGQPEVENEVISLEESLDPLHERAVAEFAQSLPTPPPLGGEDTYPDAPDSPVTAPIGEAEDRTSRASELYGPDEAGISSLNADLRAEYAGEDALELQELLLNSEITDNTSLYRQEYVPLEIAAQIKPGRALRNESFMTTAKTPEESAKRLETSINPDDTLGKIPVSFRIEADAGAPAVDLSGQSGRSSEVVLPAGVELEVKDVRWNEELDQLDVVASYDGTSVASVADLGSLEANPLKSRDTTVDDLQAALEQTNEEVNKHQFAVALDELQGSDSLEENTRKLNRAKAVRDSIDALLRAQGQGSGPSTDTAEAAEAGTQNQADSVQKISSPTEASALAETVAGQGPSADLMRSALRQLGDFENSSAYVSKDSDGNVIGAGATADYQFEGPDGDTVNYTKVGPIGAEDGAVGADILNTIIEDAGSRGRGVLLEASPNATEHQLDGQGFVADPYENGMRGNGLTPEMISARLEQGHPTDLPITEYEGTLEAQQTSASQGAPELGEVIRNGAELDSLPREAWVGLSSPDGPTEMYRRDADGLWVEASSSEDAPALTNADLLTRDAEPGSTLWFEGTTPEPPDVLSDTDGADAPLVSGDFVTSEVDGSSGTVSEIEEGGEYATVKGPDGTTSRVPVADLRKPAYAPEASGPVDNPEPDTGGRTAPNEPQRDETGEIFASDGSGLAIYEGSEVSDSRNPNYFGTVTGIDEDGEHVIVLGEDGKSHRMRAEDLDLSVSVEIEVEE